jgi:hypothetical protein
MSHLLASGLCLAGFASLALATRRQQRDVVGRYLPSATTIALRIFGAGALSGALGVLVGSHGWGLGLVMFSGHTSLAAAIVYCALIGRVRTHARALRHRQGGARSPSSPA